MDRFLITQSLLSSWNYIFSCRDGYEDDAMEEFKKKLLREPTEPSEAMLNGIAFEEEVYKESAGVQRTPHPLWESGITAVASIIQGAPVQIRLSKEAEIGGHRFLLYGILDALKAGVIYDVKFSRSYEAGKFLDSPQHSMYLELVPEAWAFTYLVSDGKDLYRETYRRKETTPIQEIIEQFIGSITDMGLFETYKEHWLAL